MRTEQPVALSGQQHCWTSQEQELMTLTGNQCGVSTHAQPDKMFLCLDDASSAAGVVVQKKSLRESLP